MLWASTHVEELESCCAKCVSASPGVIQLSGKVSFSSASPCTRFLRKRLQFTVKERRIKYQSSASFSAERTSCVCLGALVSILPYAPFHHTKCRRPNVVHWRSGMNLLLQMLKIKFVFSFSLIFHPRKVKSFQRIFMCNTINTVHAPRKSPWRRIQGPGVLGDTLA